MQLLVGLGNPGDRYRDTRHNAGFTFVDEVARRMQCTLATDRRLPARSGSFTWQSGKVHLLEPLSFMNRSGEVVQPFAAYYRIPATQILVAHDELDLPAGVVRLKSGGGHGGHNGLRSLMERLGTRDFLRLRIGIGHPGKGRDVTGYVLGKPAPQERLEILGAIDRALDVVPQLLDGDLPAAMRQLHGSDNNTS